MVSRWIGASALVALFSFAAWLVDNEQLPAAKLARNDYPTFSPINRSNTLLRNHVLQGPSAYSVETIIFSPGGRMFGLQGDGYLVEFDSDSQTARSKRVIYLGPGRLLGGKFHSDHTLFIACALKGLLRVHFDKSFVNRPSVELVYSEGITLADDIAIGPISKKVYFTVATDILPWRTRKSQDEFDVVGASILDCIRGKPAGKVLEYNPQTGHVNVLAEGLWFANGLTISPDESYLLVAETFAARLTKIWLRRPERGRREVLASRFPGYIDGVTIDPKAHTAWVAVPTAAPRLAGLISSLPSDVMDQLIRSALMLLPSWMLPAQSPYSCLVEVSLEDGAILRELQDPDGQRMRMVTSVVIRNGNLYLGSLETNFVGVIRLDSLST
ncbi:hypothetical protein GUITHDRAFT_73822 [Guillardia theta CCMP2712]|uniref:Strictosidine synthase conserved region domain-containing protein n=1 Tax=Guillardia theta (strain CCMP2712) TaxID=905079 RepID=L1J1Q3_GUITC|nr:hypothetical protein GUITHDRAFT_73822 [Guillardia theta CCMP2712]EKX42436.1 hypothetical protein GUITHDRAFT_73822 [Guillardia theta CCMP2712]|eukprot:XP_005829416.1 hypothetical protein GUITHDRAFT_73822 [Guillardia theta CCMP2712]